MDSIEYSVVVMVNLCRIFLPYKQIVGTAAFDTLLNKNDIF